MRRDRALIMGIVDRTAGAFPERGTTFEIERSVVAVRRAVHDGADIVEIDGGATGSGDEIDVDAEAERIAPAVAEVRRRFPDLAIGVVTSRSAVARLACREGADLLNDAGAGADPRMAEVAAEFGTGYVCSPPSPCADVSGASDVLAAAARAVHLVDLGVPPGGIVIDPFRDLARGPSPSPEPVQRFGELVDTGWPVLVALSDADPVGAQPNVPMRDRHVGGLAAIAVRAWQGAAIFRAHDVARARRVVDMVAVIRGGKPPVRTVRGLA